MAFWEAIQNVDVLANTKIGTMPSIGFEGSAHPIFGTDWARLVVDHAIKRGLGMTSFWSMNRDAMLQDNQGVSKQYNDFVTAMKSEIFMIIIHASILLCISMVMTVQVSYLWHGEQVEKQQLIQRYTFMSKHLIQLFIQAGHILLWPMMVICLLPKNNREVGNEK